MHGLVHLGGMCIPGLFPDLLHQRHLTCAFTPGFSTDVVVIYSRPPRRLLGQYGSRGHLSDILLFLVLDVGQCCFQQRLVGDGFLLRFFLQLAVDLVPILGVFRFMALVLPVGNVALYETQPDLCVFTDDLWGVLFELVLFVIC